MVGLFGTVFGMIKLFNSIVVAGGQPQPSHMADGISVALVTTLWGLFIAIPSLAFFGIFKNRLEALTNEAVSESEAVVGAIRERYLQVRSRDESARRQLKQVGVVKRERRAQDAGLS